MNIFRIAFELFALYLLYKLVFDFIIPVARTTKQVKKQFNEMNSHMQEQMNKQYQQQDNYASAQPGTAPKTRNDDYIEFEEIK
jgi:hypothetical protein